MGDRYFVPVKCPNNECQCFMPDVCYGPGEAEECTCPWCDTIIDLRKLFRVKGVGITNVMGETNEINK